MTIQSVSLSSLVECKDNPRKAFSAQAIEGLAASIKTDGLLQNLVVQQIGNHYLIVSGARRYRALKLLEQRRELPEDFAVPVEVRDGLSPDDSLRIATVENLQRANLAPLEETAALTKLIHKGVTFGDVVAQTGLSSTTIKRRLALNSLCRQAKRALREGDITLSQAEALTLGSHGAQQGVLESIAKGYGGYSADEIKESLLDERPCVALAIFPLEAYTGTMTVDLFADNDTSYFNDAEQFMSLQQAAVETLAEFHRESAAWVEVTNHHTIPDWQYRKAKKREQAGVVINLSPSGRVDIRQGLARPDIDADTAEQAADNPLAPSRPKASYPASLCRHIAHHKSMAVQKLLLASPRKAREVAALKALLDLKPHPCIAGLAQEANPQSAYGVLEAQARLCAQRLRIPLASEDAAWEAFRLLPTDDVWLYEAIKELGDSELDALQNLLAALAFGQDGCDALDTGDTLFNRVAQDLAADMKNHWRPDVSFLGRRSRSQLVEIARECGYADGRSKIESYKKSELVTGLSQHFADAFAATQPTASQQKAINWLPDVMRFPIIDLDAGTEETDLE